MSAVVVKGKEVLPLKIQTTYPNNLYLCQDEDAHGVILEPEQVLGLLRYILNDYNCWLTPGKLPTEPDSNSSAFLHLEDGKVLLGRLTERGWECTCDYRAIALNEIIGWLPGPPWFIDPEDSVNVDGRDLTSDKRETGGT